jgi:deoxyguanosine kinase
MSTVLIGLGSNLGDKAAHLKKAIDRLNLVGTAKSKSGVYESEPWGFEHPEKFLNMALVLDFDDTPDTLLSHCLDIETNMGRVRSAEGYEGRQIDIDILFFDDIVVDEEDLQIPHPGIEQRKFVLQPLNDLIPDYLHPVSGKSIKLLLAECTDESELTLVECTTIT